jgi:hypothetical protein
MCTFIPVFIMKLFSFLLSPQRKLRFSEWAYCYRAIRNKLSAEAENANISYLQELIDLLVSIETTLDIRNIADLERYKFNHDYQTIRLSDSMWNIIRSVKPISEEELEEEDFEGEQ